MKQNWMVVVLAALSACSGGRECEGESVRGVERLETELTRLDLPEDTPAEAWIIESQEDWDAVVAPIDGAPDMPDFDSQVAFVNLWAFDGCADFPTYTAYLYEDRLRVSFENPVGAEVCDVLIPYMDVVIVERAQEDLGWCEAF